MTNALRLHAVKQKQLLTFDQCGEDIHRHKGYRFIDGKLLHDNCFPSYVVVMRQREREERDARNVLVEG